MNPFCIGITPQVVAATGPLAVQLKDIYLSDRGTQPYLPTAQRALETTAIYRASCDLLARAFVAKSELPALALMYGPPESRDEWSKALLNNNILVLWTMGNSLPNAIAKVLKSRVATVDDVTAKRGTQADMVWVETRGRLLKAIADGFTPTSWSTTLIPAIQAAEVILPELSTTAAERSALSELYKQALTKLRLGAAEQSINVAFLNNLSSLPIPTGGTFPASNLPPPPGSKRKAGIGWEGFALMGAGFLVMGGLVIFAKKRQATQTAQRQLVR